MSWSWDSTALTFDQTCWTFDGNNGCSTGGSGQLTFGSRFSSRTAFIPTIETDLKHDNDEAVALAILLLRR